MIKKPLTLKDVIETLIVYDIEHCRFPHNYLADVNYEIPRIEGLAMDDNKLILINKELCDEEKRHVVIHELLHTKHYRIGDLKGKNIEKVVEAETVLTYLKLYGVKP